MPKSKNVGGKTKHMKKGGKDDQTAIKVTRSLNDTPVPNDYEAEDGVWMGVVTKSPGGSNFFVRQLTDKSVLDEEKLVHQLKGKIRSKSGHSFKCPKITVGSVLLCAERVYVSKEKKTSDVIYVYDPIDEVRYLKQLGVIHNFYEAYVDENIRAKMLADGADGDASKVDTGFDFSSGGDIDKNEFERI